MLTDEVNIEKGAGASSPVVPELKYHRGASLAREMTEHETRFELGTYQQRQYFLHGSASPTAETPEAFSVCVYYTDPRTDANVEVARIDTSHGHTHFDRLYRRDEPKEAVDSTYWEAVEHLMENWRTYAESYEQAHDDG
jgi:hypothetical protein